VSSRHVYISTACLHDMCEACRRSCKFCDSPCQCQRPDCTHDTTPPGPAPWVDQARGIARELFAALGPYVPSRLAQRIEDDPGLFWLRGEETPPGVREQP